jgi:OHCU decarboxylase
MRSDPADYELVAPGSLQAVVSLLATQPDEWLPIAGGTDIMVQYAAGKLVARKLVSLWNLPELRRFEVSAGELSIGAGCTYTDLRGHEVVAREFPLLVSAARWTGGIANQNRGTLGGNIVNASPAADSLPALLVYEAELALVSARGERRVRYVDFHSGYKTTLLAPGELIRAVCLARRFRGYFSYARKVAARRAQAIAKVAMAGLGRMAGGVVEDVRIALGSVAPVPLRLWETEQTVRGQVIDATLVSQAREAAAREIRPIDDIRSKATYRSAVVGNLVAEFLYRLRGEQGSPQSAVLVRWNQLPPEEAAQELQACCGSSAWARELALRRPFSTEASLRVASDEIWSHLGTEDWMEAFSKHPRIGEKSPQAASAQSRAWSAEEQRDAAAAGETLERALREANRAYEERFSRVFIVCATGKSASEILEIVRRRLRNDELTELHEAAEEQRKITNIRLKKWLSL